MSAKLRNLAVMSVLFCVTCGSGGIETIDSEEIATLPSKHPTVLVNFWATWCSPCVGEIPVFTALHRERPDVRVYAIALDEPVLEPEVAKFLRPYKIPYKVYIKERESQTEKRGRAGWLFSFEIIPITHLFKNGKLVYTFHGAVEREELLKVIDKTPEELDRMNEEFYDEDGYDADDDEVATYSD